MRTLELRIPPVAVVLVVALIMWLASSAVHMAHLPFPFRNAVALSLLGLGAGVALAGVVSFARAHTTVNPTRPDATSALVVSGIYRYTRNPMYLGMLLTLAGWAAFLANASAFLLLPVFVLYMNRFQIAPEERALFALFGDEFSAYKARVRRWL